MHLDAALLQHPSARCSLLEKRNNGEGWFDLAFFGQRLAIFGQRIGHSCVVCALG